MRTILLPFLVALLYFILAHYSLQLSFANSNATPVWPPSGFALAMMLIFGRAVLPGIFLGAFSVNLISFLEMETLSTFTAVVVSLVIALGNSLEAFLGKIMMQRLLSKDSATRFYETVNGVIIFVGTAAGICLISAIVGGSSHLFAGIIRNEFYLLTVLTWWTGDVSGILLFTPLILVWIPSNVKGFRAMETSTILEGVILIATILFVSGLVFQLWFPTNFFFTRAFLITPFLIWAAMRFKLQMVGLVVLSCGLIALYGTLSRQGPFVTGSLNASLLTVEAFIAINSVMALLLNAAIREQKITKKRLQSSNEDLELIVEERTRELGTKNQELEKSNRELAAFSYVASHDLQEPLRKIQIFSDSILHSARDRLTEKGKRSFERMGVAAKHMKQLIVDLLAYSQVTNAKPGFEFTDLNKIVNVVREEMKEQIDAKHMKLEVGELPELNVIRFQANQLFTNLISNSLKFAKPGGQPRISISATRVSSIERPETIREVGRYYWEIVFSDNGIGFEPEYAGKIFEIFQRLHGSSNVEGKGIGLAICKKILDNHEGMIIAKGVVNEGAEFRIYLPE
jgi:signal transduction histidine kinase